MNNYIGVGRIVNDTTNNTITLAITRHYKNSDGTYDTDFIDVILSDYMTQTTAEYCRKGDLIGVKGRLETRIITDDNLNKIKQTYVVADRITFISQNTINEGEI